LDPGKSGGIASIWDQDGERRIDLFKLDSTEHDTVEFLRDCVVDGVQTHAYLEKVHSWPGRGQGAPAIFTFGKNYGLLIGVLFALRIPYDYVQPEKWQRALQCLTGGDKNVSKSAAQRLFPDEHITHWSADALLIAEYGRRVRCGEL
jgi:crossover junction endodeoxyribonuclease RuvC